MWHIRFSQRNPFQGMTGLSMINLQSPISKISNPQGVIKEVFIDKSPKSLDILTFQIRV